MKFIFYHTNDLHGKLTREQAEWIRHRRQSEQDPVLHFDTGDCIKSGNLAIPLRPEIAWENLSIAGVDYGTLGNRESHVLESAFLKKLQGCKHPILLGNMKTKSNQLVFESHRIITVNNLKIGIFGVMIAMVTEKMKTQSLSQYLWDSPIPSAKAIVESLRSECDLLIGLTHIGNRQDERMAQEVPGIDLIFGGHSHTTLDQPMRVNQTQIFQAGSHARFLGRTVYQSSVGVIEHELIPMP